MIQEEIAKTQTHAMEMALPELIRNIYLPTPQLQALREQRLRALLRHCYQCSAWYREHLNVNDIECFTMADLKKLPILTKTQLMEHWDSIVTDPRLSSKLVEKHINNLTTNPKAIYLLDAYRVMVTSGSSGKRGFFVYNLKEWNTYYLQFKRFRFHDRSCHNMLLNPLQRVRIAALVEASAVHSFHSLAQGYQNRMTDILYYPPTLTVHAIVEALNISQPTILLGLPSAIVKVAKSSQIDFTPTIISTLGEPLYPDVRTQLKAIWPSASIFNNYGTSEGLSANCCHADATALHLNDDLCITEIVDQHHHGIPAGTLSDHVLITNLYNHTLPLIRYQLDDQIIPTDSTCPCGSHHQLIVEPQGRAALDFEYPPNIFVHHNVFAGPLLQNNHIEEYQVIQTKSGATIHVLTQGAFNPDAIKSQLIAQLTRLGLTNPSIKFFQVRGFDYPKSGKLQRFIPIPSP